MAEVQLRNPPRLSGEPVESQVSNLGNYQEDLYRGLLLALGVFDQIGALGQLALAISNPPTQNEVQQILAKLNDVIVACGTIEL